MPRAMNPAKSERKPPMKPKQQRLILVLIAVVAVIGAGLLASFALKDQAAYFYTPAEAKAATIRPGDAVRLGGMVQRGSVVRAGDGVTISFNLTDGQAQIPVRFTGIVPDLFAEGSGAVADGRFDASGTFVADKILAKHDERYIPPQMGQMPANAADSVVAEDAAPAPTNVAPAKAAPTPGAAPDNAAPTPGAAR